MTSTDLVFKDISEVSKLISSRQVSPVEITDQVLERIGQLNGRINAFITVTGELAKEAARAAEQEIRSGGYRGPLHGIPVSLKDIFWTKGILTTCGSKVLADFVPKENSTAWDRLEAAGAILVGKANLHEFAMGYTTNNLHYGPTRNPWDLERIPGGSSGGSGAAVAASMGYASLGTDTAGSIRVPASVCGTVGLKPTYGRVSRYGVIPCCWSLDHAGPLTKSVTDAAIVLNAIAGRDRKDASSSSAPVPDYTACLGGQVKGMRLGVPREYFYARLEPEIESAVDAALSVLEGLGAKLVEVSVPGMEHCSSVTLALVGPEASSYHKENYRSRLADYSPELGLRLQAFEFMPGTQYVTAQRVRARLVEEALGMFDKIDAFVTPTLPVAPPRIDEPPPAPAVGPQADTPRGVLENVSPINVFGFPAITVPCGFSSGSLPIGLHVVGKPFDEETILKIAYAYEQATPWHLRRPSV